MSTPEDMQGSQYGSVQLIPLEDIVESPFQVRLDYGDIDALAEDIKKLGLLQPVLCRPVNGKLEIVMGHRRTRGVKKLGWTHIRAFVKKMSDIDAIVVQGSENLQRKNYNAIEEGTLYLNYKKHVWEEQEKWVSIEAIADKFDTSASNVDLKMGLLGLPQSIQTKIINKKLAVAIGTKLVILTREFGSNGRKESTQGGPVRAVRTEKYYPEIERIGLEVEKGVKDGGLRTREAVSQVISLFKGGDSIESALTKAKKQELVLLAKKRIAEGKTEDEIIDEMKKTVKDTEVLWSITRNLVLQDLQKNLQEGHIKCPHCGKDDLEWACQHTRLIAND